MIVSGPISHCNNPWMIVSACACLHSVCVWSCVCLSVSVHVYVYAVFLSRIRRKGPSCSYNVNCKSHGPLQRLKWRSLTFKYIDHDSCHWILQSLSLCLSVFLQHPFLRDQLVLEELCFCCLCFFFLFHHDVCGVLLLLTGRASKRTDSPRRRASHGLGSRHGYSPQPPLLPASSCGSLSLSLRIPCVLTVQNVSSHQNCHRPVPFSSLTCHGSRVARSARPCHGRTSCCAQSEHPRGRGSGNCGTDRTPNHCGKPPHSALTAIAGNTECLVSGTGVLACSPHITLYDFWSGDQSMVNSRSATV
jgi:hypothetical protein